MHVSSGHGVCVILLPAIMSLKIFQFPFSFQDITLVC